MEFAQVQGVFKQAGKGFASNLNLLLGIQAAITGADAALKSYLEECQQPNADGQIKADIASAIATARVLHLVDPSSRKLCEELQGSHEPATDPFPSPLPGDPTWEVDPTDPSRSLHRTSDEQDKSPESFTVMLARRYFGEVWEAVIYNPVQDELVFAVKDQGAWMSIHGKELIRLKVSNHSDPKRIRAFKSRSNPDSGLEQFLREEGISSLLHVPGVGGKAVEIACGGVDWESVCARQDLGEAYLRRGGDLYITSERKRCDVAAAALILEEAGGNATTHDGKRLIDLLQDRRVKQVDSLLLSNSMYHNQALELCNQRMVH